MSIEKCILQGHPLLLENCDEKIDSLVIPIIQHQNTQTEEDQNTDEGTWTSNFGDLFAGCNYICAVT